MEKKVEENEEEGETLKKGEEVNNRRSAIILDKEEFYRDAVWVSGKVPQRYFKRVLNENLIHCVSCCLCPEIQVTDSDSDKFSDGEYLDDDIEKGNAVMAAVTVVIIFMVFFLCMAIMLTWTLLVLGDHQVKVV